MKLTYKILLLIIFLCLLSMAFKPRAKEPGYINMGILARIESSYNPLAFNSRTKARGLYQVTPICLKEFNQFTNKKYTLNQLFNPRINYEVSFWYINKRIPQMLRYYKKEITVRNILISYNAGISYVVENKELMKETKNYLKKYRK